MENQIVFYQNWSREAGIIHKQKHAINLMLKDGKEDQYLFAVDIRKNNQYFLELLENKLIEGYKACDLWLSGLVSSYVKSCEHEMGTQFNDEYRYHKDWLKNTLFIISDKYPKITEWCNEYLQFLQKTESDEAKIQRNKNTNKPEKIFSDCLPLDKKDILMKTLHPLLDNNTSGREVAKVLEALQYKNYLIRNSYSTPMVIVEFGIKCSKESINRMLNKKIFDVSPTKDELLQIVSILP